MEKYGQADVQAMLTVAAQISSAVDRFNLYEATGENLRRRMEELDAISRVSNELTLTFDLDQILDVIRHEAMSATKSDGSTVCVCLRPQAEWLNPDEPRMQRRIGDAEVMPDLADIEREAVLRGTDPVLILNYEDNELEASPQHVFICIRCCNLIFGSGCRCDSCSSQRCEPLLMKRAAAFLMTLSTKASLGYQNWIRLH